MDEDSITFDEMDENFDDDFVMDANADWDDDLGEALESAT